ncbi:hypothetical protein BSY18_4157 (plasmid) [Blastomonas sp. RAC04]|nr:hypothetical protein BSY18_4157 [Blastomonas sp. RAC04]
MLTAVTRTSTLATDPVASVSSRIALNVWVRPCRKSWQRNSTWTSRSSDSSTAKLVRSGRISWRDSLGMRASKLFWVDGGGGPNMSTKNGFA